MDDVIANQLASYRTRLTCLDQPEHDAIWNGQPPLMFTNKVAEARALTDELADLAGRQSAPTTGWAADKAREEDELIAEAWKLARAVVLFARDAENEVLAAKYDLPISGWRGFRDEALLQRARLLQGDADGIVTGADTANADQYGVNAAAVTALTAKTDDYEALIAAPQDAIADRSALTAALPEKSREARAKFDQLEDLLPQFGGTPAGDAFIAAYLASTEIIDRGHGPGYGEGGNGNGNGNGGGDSSSSSSSSLSSTAPPGSSSSFPDPSSSASPSPSGSSQSSNSSVEESSSSSPSASSSSSLSSASSGSSSSGSSGGGP